MTKSPQLPYNKDEDITLSLTNVNDPATSYIINKNFYRLLLNDLFLASFNFTFDTDDLDIAQYKSGQRAVFDIDYYNAGEAVYYNSELPYSSNPHKKLNLLTAIKEETKVEPSISSIIYYCNDKTNTNSVSSFIKDGYQWQENFLTIDKDDDYIRDIIHRRPLDETSIEQLENSIKLNYANASISHEKENDYVVSSGYTYTPCIVEASNTTWESTNLLPKNDKIYSVEYSWFRIYKSGFVEQGGTSKPFSLTEQWNGNNTKTLITIPFLVKANQLNVKYNFILSSKKNNFINRYDSNFDIPSLTLYQITQGRKQAKNYEFKGVKDNTNSNPLNKIAEITKDNFSIYISNESFDLNNSDIASYDAITTKISWKSSGIISTT